jgi:hypothetical protein
MVVERKIITSALVELGEEEPTTRDKWLMLDAWKKLLHTRYDFDALVSILALVISTRLCTIWVAFI